MSLVRAFFVYTCYKQIDEQPPVDSLVVEAADVQRDQLKKMVNLTGGDDDSFAQTVFDWGFEHMPDMARMIKSSAKRT